MENPLLVYLTGNLMYLPSLSIINVYTVFIISNLLIVRVGSVVMQIKKMENSIPDFVDLVQHESKQLIGGWYQIILIHCC